MIAGRIPHACLSFPASARGSCAYFGSGSVRLAKESGRPFAPSGAELRQLTAYVLQFDYHLPSLTVLETLMFHAHLRLADEVTDADKAATVAAVIRELGLGECAHVRVGSDDVKVLLLLESACSCCVFHASSLGCIWRREEAPVSRHPVASQPTRVPP